MSVHFVVDFDGTITREDATDLLLERFAAPAWLDIERAWVTGRIGSRECLARQVALLTASPAELDGAIDELKVDAGFGTFVTAAREIDASVEIISDGLDRSIDRTLSRLKVKVPRKANRLVQAGATSWRLEFPNADSGCRAGSGVCKCVAARHIRPVILIGDGRSDFCLAEEASFVFAKGKLRGHCEREGIPYRAFETFAEVTAAMPSLVPQIAADMRKIFLPE
ncbi:HAD-IB family phosphatase [Methylovirgula sp. 4M-Z18]|uniref:HAD-IB family phosphatase n=1 Tax=Methylovirgula sp. 4M-Z18 TaxID=2293567 RepID=UPI000E2EAD1B|nr:HAD-IB family phosphatase [Methylovirgula sp. 4M-Z18]RFB75559.1 2,3-diketo-5-methylthio-1-phosphopentane phosphatase [Methylovirgula sp. 4M-Z18]